MNNLVNICHIVSGDVWGGAEAQVCQVVRHTVEKDNYRVFAITFNKGALLNKLSDIPIIAVAIEENKMQPWKMIIEMRSFFKRNKVDLVHCHGFKENFLGGLAAKLLLRPVTIRTHHGRGVVDGSFIKVTIEKINAYLLTNKMIAVSHELKKYLIGLGFPSNKIHVIHNGIDCDNLTVSKTKEVIRGELSISSSSFVIGTASRIEREKGYDYLLLALKELIDKAVPAVLVIVGTGKLLHKYEQMAQEMNISDSVIFTGFREDVCNYINIFDVFVMMSLNEGIPLALIEAMGMGKAVVSSAVGGIPEVIESDSTGVLVPNQDFRSCATACRKILSDYGLLVQLGKNARKHVNENFSSIKTSKNTINLYEKILNR